MYQLHRTDRTSKMNERMSSFEAIYVFFLLNLVSLSSATNSPRYANDSGYFANYMSTISTNSTYEVKYVITLSRLRKSVSKFT